MLNSLLLLTGAALAQFVILPGGQGLQIVSMSGANGAPHTDKPTLKVGQFYDYKLRIQNNHPVRIDLCTLGIDSEVYGPSCGRRGNPLYWNPGPIDPCNGFANFGVPKIPEAVGNKLWIEANGGTRDITIRKAPWGVGTACDLNLYLILVDNFKNCGDVYLTAKFTGKSGRYSFNAGYKATIQYN